MKILRRILVILAAAFVVVQFFRPEKNVSQAAEGNHIEQRFPIPIVVQETLLNSCYDCHSNNTRYPWYAEIQPVAWWLGKHIEEGTGEMNFDEFAGYRPRKQFVRFRQIEELITENDMPLPSYTFIHRDAILSEEQKELVIGWSRAMRDSMENRYPSDSLARR